MSEDKQPPKLAVVPELDAEEAEFRKLCLNSDDTKGASAAGLLAISIGKAPEKNAFFRTHPDFRPTVWLVNVQAGFDVNYVAVIDSLVEPLAAIGITARKHTVYLTVTSKGGLRAVPVAGPDDQGEMNEYNRTKEFVLIQAQDVWMRLWVDKEGGAYRGYQAPEGRYGDPPFPQPFKAAKIFKLLFRDRGRLIDSLEHKLVLAWAGRDK